LITISEVIEFHGGTIGANSAGNGMGTMFYVELPLYHTNCELVIDSEVPTYQDNTFHMKSLKKTSKLFSTSSNKITVINDESDKGQIDFSDIESGAPKEPSLRKSDYEDKIVPFDYLHLSVREQQYSANVSCSDLSLPFINANTKSSSKLLSCVNELKILVVDDSLINRKMSINLLKSAGHYVDQAVDGIDFLKKLNITIKDSDQSFCSEGLFPVYDFILLDESMPNMSGPDSAKIARNLGYKGLIYGMTGNTDKEDNENFIGNGVNDVFHKPIDLDHLKIAISRDLALH
jgi:CheY-like chemotaxis protein